MSDARLKALEDAEDMLWRLDARLADAGLPENDKLRTLAFYAWQEARGQIEAAEQASPLPPPTREELFTSG